MRVPNNSSACREAGPPPALRNAFARRIERRTSRHYIIYQ
jgi:hypothetical protein